MVCEDKKKGYLEPTLQVIDFVNDVLTNGSQEIGSPYPSDWENGI